MDTYGVEAMTKLDNRSPYAAPFGGPHLREAMAQAGVTKGWLAAVADVSPRAVEHWLSGKRPVPALVRKVMRGMVAGVVPRDAIEVL